MSFVTLSHLSKFATAFAEKVTELFVRKESGKGLSSNDYTTEEKEKLSGISEGANKTTVDTALSTTSTNPVQNKVVKAELDKKAPLASPTLTGKPLAPTAAEGTNTTQIATTAFVQNAVSKGLAAGDAMVFKGTLGTGGTVTALPAVHEVGWTYKVITAGTYAGNVCEVGDMIICSIDGTAANDAHWTVVQANLDGAVTGPASSVDKHVAVFSGASGKVVKDSGFTIGKSVPADAKFTDTTYTKFGGASSSAAGTDGLVPAPASGATTQFLRSDGKWGTPANTTYSKASTTADGLMSKEDKKKVDGITEATDTEIDKIINGLFA